MTLVRWDPFREIAQVQQHVNRAFADAFGRNDEGLFNAGAWVPPVDIYQENDHELVLSAELPDMTRDDIEITVDNNTLTVRGEKKLPAHLKEEQYRRVERRYGTFSRSFSLPPTVDAGKVAAEYRNGVLTVRLPLREEAKPRQIKVNVAA
jgi:HSP20 family protein